MAQPSQSPNSDVTNVDGMIDWSGGVNSIKVTTIQSQQNPNGLARNELAWLINATVRDGGITPRSGLQPKGVSHDGSALYQGGWMYSPIDDTDPYLVCSIGGHIYQINADTGAPVDLSVVFGLFNPPTIPKAYFCQGEEFLIIQAGDNVTPPLFWDGVILRRSGGLAAPATIPGVVTIKNNADAADVGRSSVAGNYGVPGTSLVGLDSFVVPAVGATVAVNVAQFSSPTLPTPYFQILIQRPGHPNGLGGSFSVVAYTPPITPPTVTELPPALAMDYYMGRLWYAQGRIYTAGDIVGGPSGSLPYQFRDSILKVTENPLALGGDGFSVPSNAGNIRAIAHNATIDTALGQGQLFIFTRKAIYSLTVPVTRLDWIGADVNNTPLQKVAQLVNGSVNDWSVVPVNGDLFFQSLEPGIRSLISAVRYFSQWGNVQISSNENRLIQFNDRSLLQFASGISFDNRMIQTALPKQTPQGVVHQALVPLDFTSISNFGSDLTPVWEGSYEGLNVLQLFTGNFGGRERAFMFVVDSNNAIALWEMIVGVRTDNGDNRITMQVEFPALTWGNEFNLKRLVGAELWVDRLWGTVVFELEYRPDGATCWLPWHKWKSCAARTSCEDAHNPICYPLTQHGEGYKQTMVLPKPPNSCESMTGRPSDIGYQMQARLTVHGYCRVRGFILHAQNVERALYRGIVC